MKKVGIAALAAVVEHDDAFDETALRTALQAKLGIQITAPSGFPFPGEY